LQLPTWLRTPTSHRSLAISAIGAITLPAFAPMS
jgi:hypothetical protein